MTASDSYTLYYYPSPNSLKVVILLQELGQGFRPVLVDLAKGEQLDAAYARMCPNRKVPVLVVDDQTALFESGAILEWLAERHGAFLGRDDNQRWVIKQWLYWQMAALGPAAGQAQHFRCFAPEQVPYGIRRYSDETNRLYGVLDERLRGRDWIADEYSIADMACWPWVLLHQLQGQRLEDFPDVNAWYMRMAARPAVASSQAHYGIKLISPEDYGVLLNQTADSLQSDAPVEDS